MNLAQSPLSRNIKLLAMYLVLCAASAGAWAAPKLCEFEESVTFLKEEIRYVGLGCPERWSELSRNGRFEYSTKKDPLRSFPNYHDIRYKTQASHVKGLLIDNMAGLKIHSSGSVNEIRCEILIPIAIPRECTIPLFSVHSTAAAYLSANHKARLKVLVKDYNREDRKPDGFATHQFKGGNHEVNVYSTYHQKGAKPPIVVPCGRQEAKFMLSVMLVAKHRSAATKKSKLESHVTFDSLAVLFSQQKHSNLWQIKPCD